MRKRLAEKFNYNQGERFKATFERFGKRNG